MTIQVSVVVPTFKRPLLLQRCLAALLAQDFDPTAYEVLVVDDAACEETRCLVEQINKDNTISDPIPVYHPVFAQFAGQRPAPVQHRYLNGPGAPDLQREVAPYATDSGRIQKAPPLRYLAVTGVHGPAAARNCGWRAAQGGIIAFTDDDCIPQPGWLKAGTAAMVDGILGAAGEVVVPLPEDPSDYELNAAGIQGLQFLTCNCFYRRELLASVGGFDERFTMAWREDSDLFFTLLERFDGDSRLVHTPDAVVVHPIRPAPWGISISQQRKSMFNALLYKKHPDLYRALIQPSPPWRYYQTVGALLLAATGILTGQVWLALLGGGLWLWLTGRFSLLRLRHTSHAPRHVTEMIVTSAMIPFLAIFWRLLGALKFRVFFL